MSRQSLVGPRDARIGSNSWPMRPNPEAGNMRSIRWSAMNARETTWIAGSNPAGSIKCGAVAQRQSANVFHNFLSSPTDWRVRNMTAGWGHAWAMLGTTKANDIGLCEVTLLRNRLLRLGVRPEGMANADESTWKAGCHLAGFESPARATEFSLIIFVAIA